MEYTNKGKIDLLRESMKDLVLFYSESDERSGAERLFPPGCRQDNYLWMLESWPRSILKRITSTVLRLTRNL